MKLSEVLTSMCHNVGPFLVSRFPWLLFSPAMYQLSFHVRSYPSHSLCSILCVPCIPNHLTSPAHLYTSSHINIIPVAYQYTSSIQHPSSACLSFLILLWRACLPISCDWQRAPSQAKLASSVDTSSALGIILSQNPCPPGHFRCIIMRHSPYTS